MKIHTLLKKEEIDSVQMNKDKIAVVFDVLLATSTITACFYYGANRVIPVMDGNEALVEAKNIQDREVALVGEYNGVTIEGFLDPLPSILQRQVLGKDVILSTTNGTVAIRKSSSAKEVYIASLLNGNTVCEHIAKQYNGETIIVVCSGSSNTFCLEDFYGAGYFISQLIKTIGIENVELTDSSLAATLFYENRAHESLQILTKSRVGANLKKYHYEYDLSFVSQQGVLPLVLKLEDKKYITSVTNSVIKPL
ncbi:2-phosphosulfolactate phosphatase [Bacillus andreraoultii]|uniref:2-phosphosulfolactate phosphatase n=1 Tax=Bacillus andreraoultii TaxID=1499685 RepID=UPI000AA5FA08|nr:2-phosphosulfolactate phosphatase [Bacillus andreraoultii]